MPISAPVRAHFTRLMVQTGRERVPKNFRPLDVPATGKSSVEGCAGGGKNILELSVVCDVARIVDLRASCGLCNPAMSVAADLVCEWARGLEIAAVMAADPFDAPALDPLFALLGGTEKPADAREKFQYAVFALQNALRSHRGEAALPIPKISTSPAADAG